MPSPSRARRRRRWPIRVLPAALAVVALAFVLLRAQGDESGSGAEVVRVVDGDTLVVEVAGYEERVRLIGIDTPESVDPRRPVECFGREAARYTSELLPPGTPVRLVRDVEARDRFGRLLAYVYREPDGVFVNLRLIEDGYAQVATYPPNLTHVEQFTAAAARARDEGRGLWSRCDDAAGQGAPSNP